MCETSSYGFIVVIKRNGEDGGIYPVNEPSVSFGRDQENDIRIILSRVSRRHCVVLFDEKRNVCLPSSSSHLPPSINQLTIIEKKKRL